MLNNSNGREGNFKRKHFGRLKHRGLVSDVVFGLLYVYIHHLVKQL